MMLLNGLKRLCGNVLAQHLSDQNMVSMYRYAQTFNLSGLEEECKSYMAAVTQFHSISEFGIQQKYTGSSVNSSLCLQTFFTGIGKTCRC